MAIGTMKCSNQSFQDLEDLEQARNHRQIVIEKDRKQDEEPQRRKVNPYRPRRGFYSPERFALHPNSPIHILEAALTKPKSNLEEGQNSLTVEDLSKIVYLLVRENGIRRLQAGTGGFIVAKDPDSELVTPCDNIRHIYPLPRDQSKLTEIISLINTIPSVK